VLRNKEQKQVGFCNQQVL